MLKSDGTGDGLLMKVGALLELRFGMERGLGRGVATNPANPTVRGRARGASGRTIFKGLL